MGIVIAVIVDAGEAAASRWILAPQWDAVMASLGRPQVSTWRVASFAAYGLVIGLAAAWIYVAIRPRFGPGPSTALFAGLVTWVLGYAVADATIATIGLLPARLMLSS